MKDPATHVRPQETERIADGSTIPRVLFLRNDPAGCSLLVDQLRHFGCECQVVSFREGLALLAQEHFHILFSELNISESITSRLISQLAGSRSSLFLHLEVEDGCWWLPAVVAGQDCRGTPALRPKDFHPVLKGLLQEIVSGPHQIRPRARLFPSSFFRMHAQLGLRTTKQPVIDAGTGVVSNEPRRRGSRGRSITL
jgi:hypothetical protein